MPKREGELKSAFTKEFKRQLPNFLTLLQKTRGAPDRAIIGAARTTFWEFKHGTPAFTSHGDQELMCLRLAGAGYCRYVIWQEDHNGNAPRTLIVHPRNVKYRASWDLIADTWTVGFDHRWLVEQIRKVHNVGAQW